MTKKKKLYLIAIMPAVFTVVVIGGILSFVLIAGAGKAPTAAPGSTVPEAPLNPMP